MYLNETKKARVNFRLCVEFFRQRVYVALSKRRGAQPHEQDNEVGEQIIDWPRRRSHLDH